MWHDVRHFFSWLWSWRSYLGTFNCSVSTWDLIWAFPDLLRDFQILTSDGIFLCWPGLDSELNLGLVGLDWRLESRLHSQDLRFTCWLCSTSVSALDHLHTVSICIGSNALSDELFLRLSLRLWTAAAAGCAWLYSCNFLVQGFLLELYRRKQRCLRATSGNMLLIIGLNVFLAPSPQFSESCRSTVWPWSLRCFMDRQSKEAEWWSPGACKLLSRLKCVFITP